MTGHPLFLEPAEKTALWNLVTRSLDRHRRELERRPVECVLTPEAADDLLGRLDLSRPTPPADVLALVLRGMNLGSVQMNHPRYFGLFNPAPADMGVVGDALVAALNPQLATWNHASFPIAVERRLLRWLAGKLGFEPRGTEGTFCSGGAEANHTALLLALHRVAPDFAATGVRGLSGAPTLYVTTESHHSVVKAARACGLGAEAVRTVRTDAELRLDPVHLEEMVAADRRAGLVPVMAVGTAGTTSGGIIDPLPGLAAVAGRHGLWLHVDAAYGGPAALLPELKGALAGIERADSVTVDAHKWLSVPMAAGMLLTRHRHALASAFHTEAGYMPTPAGGPDQSAIAAERDRPIDPYSCSLQWSRRFIGLKLFLTLAVAGESGYETVLRHQVAMAAALRARLTAGGWRVENDTPLPVVCFNHAGDLNPAMKTVHALSRRVAASGKAWISSTRLGSRPVLRACITHADTQERDLDILMEALAEAVRRS